MIKVKIKELVEFRNCFYIFEETAPIRVAFTFEKIKSALDKEFPFYQSKLREIISDCAIFDEEGRLIPTETGEGFNLKEDKVGEFYTRVGELDSLEVEIPCSKFSLADLEKINIKIDLMKFLMPFIEE